MKSRRALLATSALAAALLSSAALALPDLARGLAALERGELAAAEADLRPLAEQGFPEAQVALARLYSRHDSTESMEKAVYWYRKVAQRDPQMRVALARALLNAGSVADPAEIDRLLESAATAGDPAALALRLRLYRAFPTFASAERGGLLAQRVAASPQLEQRAEAIAWYRDHAQTAAYGEALAALCEKDRKLIEACYADLARHFRGLRDSGALQKVKAEAVDLHTAGKLSDETLERVARALSADDLPGEPMAAEAYALLAKAKQLSPEGLARQARLLIADPALDEKTDARELLDRAHAQGSAEAALQLGRLYMDPRSPQVDPDRAERLLGEAALRLPAAHFYLGRLFERGYRGHSNVQRAQRHFLLAARGGYPRADLALARLYWNNRGVRMDAVKSYAFARLAEHDGAPGAAEQLESLRTAISAEEIAAGHRLAEQEFAARRAAQEKSGDLAITTAEYRKP